MNLDTVIAELSAARVPPTTRTDRRQALSRYTRWCAAQGLEPAASERQVLLFFHAHYPQWSWNHAKGMRSLLRGSFLDAGDPDPFGPDSTHYLAVLRRDLGSRRAPRTAPVMTDDASAMASAAAGGGQADRTLISRRRGLVVASCVTGHPVAAIVQWTHAAFVVHDEAVAIIDPCNGQTKRVLRRDDPTGYAALAAAVRASDTFPQDPEHRLRDRDAGPRAGSTGMRATVDDVVLAADAQQWRTWSDRRCQRPLFDHLVAVARAGGRMHVPAGERALVAAMGWPDTKVTSIRALLVERGLLRRVGTRGWELCVPTEATAGAPGGEPEAVGAGPGSDVRAIMSAWRRAGLTGAAATDLSSLGRADRDWLLAHVDPDYVRQCRNVAYLLVGVSHARRHIDLARLDLADVTTIADGFSLRISRHKTSPDGSRPLLKHVTHVRTHEDHGACLDACPACALAAHLEVVRRSGRTTGPLFATYYGGQWRQMTRQAGRLIVRGLWESLHPGDAAEAISTRSLRVGGATSAARAGWQVWQIACDLTDHATLSQCQLYIRRLDPWAVQFTLDV